MNKFEMRKAEALQAAKLLMMRLHQHRLYLKPHHSDPKEQELCPAMFQAVENILRRHVLEEPFKLGDVVTIQKALNLRASLAGLQFSDAGDVMITDVALLILDNDPQADFELGTIIKWGKRTIRTLEKDEEEESLRSLAEMLLRYLELFKKTKELMDAKPIGICARTGCNILFSKNKVDQKYCSVKCKERAFRAEKGPGYYRDYRKQARKDRQARQARQKKAQQRKLRTPTSLQSKSIH